MEHLVQLRDSLLHAWRTLPLGPIGRSIVWVLGLGSGLFLCKYLVERVYGAPYGQYASRSFLKDIAYWFYCRTGLHYVLFLAPMLLLGFSESTWMPVVLLGGFKELVQHSRIPWRFGALYPVLVSPVFHSYHHSKDPAHYDKNFAGLLSVWDYLFGTAVIDDRRGPASFGLQAVVPTTLASTLVAPFRLLRVFYGLNTLRRQ